MSAGCRTEQDAVLPLLVVLQPFMSHIRCFLDRKCRRVDSGLCGPLAYAGPGEGPGGPL